MLLDESVEAGPSRLRTKARPNFRSEQEGEMIEIPSTGVEFFEYRRRLFLAGLPLPIPRPINSNLKHPTINSMPSTIHIPSTPPEPLPRPTNPTSSNSSAVQRIEDLLALEGSEELQSTWVAGIDKVASQLHAGKRLSRGLRLGLVIKILKASWIQDGLWPKDDDGRPVKPPESPIIPGVELFPETEIGQDDRRYDERTGIGNGDGNGPENGHGKGNGRENVSNGHKDRGVRLVNGK
ncbi:uncharacterized protein I303_104592 [Kwoniella dejecticola CBS 10117]|uniref:Uncharacterized protein n=1 Tax=Kwoniella dejecticola CBS 10117 TaxID=1296121 RepID=A0A1A6A4W0_9TREE|nr:uncharacterized protein I303_04430 [Kwoniella dejecticola CBS 10117]OBR85099.1 hypothetical protein I303_04430 [Kwoniella dejecticola CBS 10117]